MTAGEERQERPENWLDGAVITPVIEIVISQIPCGVCLRPKRPRLRRFRTDEMSRKIRRKYVSSQADGRGKRSQGTSLR